jgi:Flp pilus assembly protein TadD
VQGDPNNAWYHNMLGWALESKGDPQGALQEYRAAYLLLPSEAGIRANYERLLNQVKK